jgi:hypothetical protein
MWPVIPTSNQDVRQAKNEKKGGCNLKKMFSETAEPFSTKLCRNDPWVVPFQKCVRHFGRRAEPPDTFLIENHPMTISSKFSSY